MLNILKKIRYRKIKKLKEVAKNFERQNDWSKAFAIWSIIAKQDPSYNFAYIKLGNICNELGDRHQAIAHFQKISDDDDQYVYEKHVGIAGVYERMEDWNASLAAWEKAIESVASLSAPSSKIALALAHKAKCLLKLNRQGESNIFITAAIYLDRTLRGDTDAILTRMSLAQGNPAKIRAIVDRARRLGNYDEIIEETMLRLI